MGVRIFEARRHWGQVALLAGVIVFVVWYLADSAIASARIQNLLFIVPVGAVALLLAVHLLLRAGAEMRREGGAFAAPGAEEVAAPPRDFRHRYGIPASMASMVAYVIALPWIGFDLATFAFVAANMRIYGERSLLLILVYAAALAVAVTAAMKHLLFVPIPTLLPL